MKMKKMIISVIMSIVAIVNITPSSVFAGGSGGYYTVVDGDCWSTIADKTCSDVDTLISANNGSYDEPLEIGEVIYIPYNVNNIPEETTYTEWQPDPEDPANQTEEIDNDYTFDIEEFVRDDYYNLGFESPDYGYIKNGFYFPAPNEGWYSVAEHSNYSLSALLNANNATIDTPIYYGLGIILPGTECEAEDYVEAVKTYEEVIIGESTIYNNPGTDSWYNIARAAEMMDGIEIQPGEEFSAYDFFGDGHAGLSDGFIEANYFIDSERVGRAPGSGICFNHTGLAKAGDEAGMEFVERHPHCQDIMYATRGVDDAAVNFDEDPLNRQDLKFINPIANTVRVHTYCDSFIGSLRTTISKLVEVIR